MTSCMSIGSDVNTWRLFHNPDPMQFSGGEFHMDSASVVEVTTSDPVFAQVSRAYALASSWSGAAAGATTGGFNSGSFGGYAWSMTGGKNLLVGTTQPVQTPVISQPIVAGPITNNPVVGNPVASANASASASASASAGASASANAVVENTTPKPNPWSNIFGTGNNWSGFFG